MLTGNNLLISFLIFCVSMTICICTTCGKEKKCKTSRIHGLRTSDCFDMDFREFPKCLPSNVDVIELSYNRIRKVSKEDLKIYPNLAHLYLTDNLIVNLEDDTFAAMTHLETLDLSVNALSKIPSSIFQLASLKTLYLRNNTYVNVAESIKEASPIYHSTLTKLDISYITEDSSTDFPDFTELPLVANLNITGDRFSTISPAHFAKLCNLQVLINNNVATEFEEACDCWKINKWLTSRKVQFTPFYCTLKEQDCPEYDINQNDTKLFQTCTEKINVFYRSKLLGKIGLWTGFALALVLCTVFIICYMKRRKNRQIRENREMVLKLKDKPLLT